MSLDPVTALLDIGGKLIDRLFPDPIQKAAAQLELVKLQQSGELAQLNADVTLSTAQAAINTEEAKSTNWFVSGWRPYIGWTCGTGLAFQFVVAPLATWGATLYGHPVVFPTLDMGTLVTLLFGMLGLGGMRTYEKLKGVSS